MTQPGDFDGTWKIQKWCTDDPRYPALVKEQTDLHIKAKAEPFNLEWEDQIKESCTLTGFKFIDGKLCVESSEIKGTTGLPPQLLGATVEFTDLAHKLLKVTLYFSLDQDGPKGTITAEANPGDGLRRRRWSFFRWLRSLFR